MIVKNEDVRLESEQENIRDLSNKYNREDMFAAFRHGREFEQIESEGDFNPLEIEIKYLPFSEWLTRYKG